MDVYPRFSRSNSNASISELVLAGNPDGPNESTHRAGPAPVNKLVITFQYLQVAARRQNSYRGHASSAKDTTAVTPRRSGDTGFCELKSGSARMEGVLAPACFG